MHSDISDTPIIGQNCTALPRSIAAQYLLLLDIRLSLGSCCISFSVENARPSKAHGLWRSSWRAITRTHGVKAGRASPRSVLRNYDCSTRTQCHGLGVRSAPPAADGAGPLIFRETSCVIDLAAHRTSHLLNAMCRLLSCMIGCSRRRRPSYNVPAVSYGGRGRLNNTTAWSETGA